MERWRSRAACSLNSWNLDAVYASHGKTRRAFPESQIYFRKRPESSIAEYELEQFDVYRKKWC